MLKSGGNVDISRSDASFERLIDGGGRWGEVVEGGSLW